MWLLLLTSPLVLLLSLPLHSVKCNILSTSGCTAHHTPTYGHHQHRLEHPLLGGPFGPPFGPPHRLALALHLGGGGGGGCSGAGCRSISRRLCLCSGGQRCGLG
jgi:hypothetical protein